MASTTYTILVPGKVAEAKLPAEKREALGLPTPTIKQVGKNGQSVIYSEVTQGQLTKLKKHLAKQANVLIVKPEGTQVEAKTATPDPKPAPRSRKKAAKADPTDEALAKIAAAAAAEISADEAGALA